MISINYQEIIDEQKRIYDRLCQRIEDIMLDVRGMGNYFVCNINTETVNLYADLLKMKRLSDGINNMLKNQYLTYSYASSLRDGNMRLDKIVESVKNQLKSLDNQMEYGQ